MKMQVWNKMALLAVSVSIGGASALAAEGKTEVKKSTWEQIVSKIRMRTFSEVMSPSFSDSSSVPTSDGKQLDPVNMFNIAWVDYEFAKDWRALYFQRFVFNFTANEANPQGFGGVFLDPRFGIRRTNAIPIQGFNSTWDLYVQPGVSPGSLAAGRILDVGLQMSNSYTIPKTKLTLGLLSDIRGSAYREGGSGNDFAFTAAPWVSYEILPWLSTQHWFFSPIRHAKGADQISWNYPGAAMMQNGLGFQLGSRVWTAVMVNNYLTEVPTLNNTWFSLWMTVTIL
jgi:hypothetical protein